VPERPPRNHHPRTHNEQGRVAQCGDKRQTGPVEHEGFPAADYPVLEISVLGDPEIAAKAFNLEPGAVRDPERFALLEVDRGIERSCHGRLPCMRPMHPV